MSVVRKAIILGESEGDREAIAVLAGAVAPSIAFDYQTIAQNSYGRVRKLILPTLHQIADRRMDHDALIVVVDSDDCPVDPTKDKSRLAHIQSLIKSEPRLASVPTAIGIAAPAIEAWLLHNQKAGCTENGWENELAKMPRRLDPRDYKNGLKEALYGKKNSPLIQHQKMVARMRELIAANQLDALSKSFPLGFGTMLDAIRSWNDT